MQADDFEWSFRTHNNKQLCIHVHTFLAAQRLRLWLGPANAFFNMNLITRRANEQNKRDVRACITRDEMKIIVLYIKSGSLKYVYSQESRHFAWFGRARLMQFLRESYKWRNFVRMSHKWSANVQVSAHFITFTFFSSASSSSSSLSSLSSSSKRRKKIGRIIIEVEEFMSKAINGSEHRLNI